MANTQAWSRVRRSSVVALAWAAFAALFAASVLGFADTVTGSAMGCGRSWPLCNGHLLPTQWSMQTLIEFGHRASVMVASWLLLAVAGAALGRYGRRREIRWLVGLAVAGVMLEATLGALTVLFNNPPAVLAMHMGTSMLSLIGTMLLAVVTGQLERNGGRAALARPLRPVPATRALRRWTWVSLVYSYVAMYVGAFVAFSGAGGLFTGWPLPLESWSQVGWVVALDWLHRGIALGFVFLCVHLLRLAWRTRAQRPDLLRASVAALSLVLAQAVSGALLLYFHLAVWTFLLHVTLVTVLVLCLFYMGLQVLPDPAAKRVSGIHVLAASQQARQRAGA
ncbi:MAG: COX15/CtaA family protein [Alicyclobacillus sp.]|nr:COX15/CtaA family protein [Alicyclobacillus sp.]